MADVQAVQPVRGTVGYQYKVPTGEDFCFQEASVYIPFEVDQDDPTVTRQRIAETLTAAKQLVYEGLGVEYESSYDDDGIERATAVIQKAFPGAVVVTDKGKNAPTPAGNGGGGGGGGRVRVLKPLEGHPIPEWLDEEWQRKVDAGQIHPDNNEVWDNRKFLPQFGGTRSDKQPWFRATKDADGGADGQKAGIWPPKEGNR